MNSDRVLALRGKLIRQRRKELKLSRPKLAQRVGCTENTIINYEKGRTDARMEILHALATALDMDIEYLANPQPDYVVDFNDDDLPEITNEQRIRLGNLICDKRREKRLTQLDLALEMGCNAAVVSYYETNKRLPCTANLVYLAKRLGFSIDEVFGVHCERTERHDERLPDGAG